MLVSRVICQTNWNKRFYVVFQCIISHGWQATGSQSPLLILLQCRQGNMGDVVGATAWGSKIYGIQDVCFRCVRCMQCLCCGFVIDDVDNLMIQPQVPKCSRPFQLNLLFWGIVPCVSKIDTLGLFHSLL